MTDTQKMARYAREVQTYKNIIDRQAEEIDRLRAALKAISHAWIVDGDGAVWSSAVAHGALRDNQQKST